MDKKKLFGFSLILLLYLFVMPGINGCDRSKKISASELEKTKEEIDGFIAKAKATQDGFILEKITSKVSEVMVRIDFKRSDWAYTRRMVVEFMFHVQVSIRDAIDLNFDIKNLPPMNISPGGGYPPGIAPEAISEKDIRTKYEEQLKKQSELIRQGNFQERVRKYDQHFQQILEKFLVSAYQLPPRNSSELEQLMAKYNVEVQTKDKIIQQLRDQD